MFMRPVLAVTWLCLCLVALLHVDTSDTSTYPLINTFTLSQADLTCCNCTSTDLRLTCAYLDLWSNVYTSVDVSAYRFLANRTLVDITCKLCGINFPVRFTSLCLDISLNMSTEELNRRITLMQEQLNATALEEELRQQRTLSEELQEKLDQSQSRLDRSLHSESEVRTVYISKETTKIPKLKGAPKKDDDIDVEDWIDDVRRHLEASHLDNKEKVEFILQHLGGAAKWEVKLRAESDREDPQCILHIIKQCLVNLSLLLLYRKLSSVGIRTQMKLYLIIL